MYHCHTIEVLKCTSVVDPLRFMFTFGFGNMSREALVESLNFQISGSWCFGLTSFCSMFKVLRAPTNPQALYSYLVPLPLSNKWTYPKSSHNLKPTHYVMLYILKSKVAWLWYIVFVSTLMSGLDICAIELELRAWTFKYNEFDIWIWHTLIMFNVLRVWVISQAFKNLRKCKVVMFKVI